jgi:glycosyltransferase involved in cell wall biosynthesis
VLRDLIAATGVKPDRLAVVQNGVVLARFLPPTPRPDDPTRPVRLGFVGFVRDWHGMDAVIRAMAAQPRSASGAGTVELVVIGDGPARPELEALAAACGIPERVRFTGVVEHELVPALVGEFDIALQPRVTGYASPLKIFDYMAAGCAIVAPDQPNIRELLEHGRTALLVDPDTKGAMWGAIARLADDVALRRRLGAAARAELERQDYTWRGNAARVAAWAAGLVAGRVGT